MSVNRRSAIGGTLGATGRRCGCDFGDAARQSVRTGAPGRRPNRRPRSSGHTTVGTSQDSIPGASP